MLTPQTVKPCRTRFCREGMGEAGLARFHGQAHAAHLFRQHRLTALAHSTLEVEKDQSSGIAHQGRCSPARKRPGARLFPSGQGHVGEHR